MTSVVNDSWNSDEENLSTDQEHYPGCVKDHKEQLFFVDGQY